VRSGWAAYPKFPLRTSPVKCRLKLDEKLVAHVHATVEGVIEPVPVQA
jgi:hypothetical protein